VASFGYSTLQRFAGLVAARLGLRFEKDRFDMLGEVLRRRLVKRRQIPCEVYLASLTGSADAREEWRALAAELTVTETYFFRAGESFEALAGAAVPDRLRTVGGRRPLRLLSAGCASGEEAYSMAILLKERFPQYAAVHILGIDVNPAALAVAREGCYRPWSLRETPPPISDRYFTRRDGYFNLLPAIRSLVNWEERNLGVGDIPWHPEPFDVIFCRNVLMYLVPEAARLAVARLSSALAPGGFLFLSHAENLRGLSQDFHLRHTHDTFYYQKRSEGCPAPARDGCQSAGLPAGILPPPPEMADSSWFEAVGRSSARIEMLSRESGLRDGNGAGPRIRATAQPLLEERARVQLRLALECLRQERFRDALDIVEGLAPDMAGDRDTELLRAVLLTNCGDVAAAEEVCRSLLARDELNASARYLMALCREHAGDPVAAMEQDRAAIYLDPSFAMPHLHLGLLARRAGDLATARREIAEAQALLRREDTARILLLGGGFGRQALANLAEAQLRACGGAA
jgi:chemotaxis protein methyltransferase CheR